MFAQLIMRISPVSDRRTALQIVAIATASLGAKSNFKRSLSKEIHIMNTTTAIVIALVIAALLLLLFGGGMTTGTMFGGGTMFSGGMMGSGSMGGISWVWLP